MATVLAVAWPWLALVTTFLAVLAYIEWHEDHPNATSVIKVIGTALWVMLRICFILITTIFVSMIRGTSKAKQK